MTALSRRPTPALYETVKSLIDTGHPVDPPTGRNNTPLSHAYYSGHADIVRLLIQHGANTDIMGWSPLHKAVVAGDIPAIATAATDADHSHRGKFDHTPFLTAVHLGNVAAAATLRPYTTPADRQCGKGQTPALVVTANWGRTDMIRHLLDQGDDVNSADLYGRTALLAATEWGSAASVDLLLNAEADIRASENLSAAWRPSDPANMPDYETIYGVADYTTNTTLADLFIARGMQHADFSQRIARQWVRCDLIPTHSIAADDFDRHKHRIFGKGNPERTNHPFWVESLRTGKGAYAARQTYGLARKEGQPVFCFERFGQSTTPLPDGRWIQIGGEHEDFYDPDFCIYNDVVVHDGKGVVDIYSYPREVFQPTDFHTATCVENEIIIIGNLGYVDDRRAGTTPVYALDLNSFAIRKVATSGQAPGWLHGHRSHLVNGEIVVTKGNLWSNDTRTFNTNTFKLSLTDMRWSVIEDNIDA